MPHVIASMENRLVRSAGLPCVLVAICDNKPIGLMLYIVSETVQRSHQRRLRIHSRHAGISHAATRRRPRQRTSAGSGTANRRGAV